MATPSCTDVDLCLRLYEQRREPVLRDARNWLGDFNPKSFDDVKAVMDGSAGPLPNRYFRQVSSYWEMISTLMLSGGIPPEGRDLFVATTKEFVFVWAKFAPFIAEMRAMGGPRMMGNLEAFARSLPDYDMLMARFTAMFVRMSAAAAKQKSGARKSPSKKSAPAKKNRVKAGR